MGLDMFARTLSEAPTTDVDFKPAANQQKVLHYWRKHPDLHGWMGRLYIKKGGIDPNFNCNTVVLTASDLDDLERDVLAGNLPRTSGFYFGQSSPERQADDMAFIAKARAAIAEGMTVYYDSWW